MNVLVYTGPEVITTSLTHTLSTLRTLLTPNYTVQTVTAQSVQSQPWSVGCALLVIPGCRGTLPAAVRPIVEFVEKGGSLLGFRTGALRTGTGLDSMGSLSLDSVRDTPFRFHDRPSKSYITLSPVTISQELDAVTLNPSRGTAIEGVRVHAEVRGFDGQTQHEVLGHYTDISSEKKSAGVQFKSAGGSVVVWAAALEDPIADREQQRLAILKENLTFLGLKLPSDNNTSLTRPTPLILVGHPDVPKAVTSVLAAVINTSDLTYQTLQDENDTFEFVSPADLANVTRKCNVEYASSVDPASWQPKRVVVYPAEQKPRDEDTPLFSIERYFVALARARAQEQCVDTTKYDTWGMGQCMMYGQVVTSTQTMLDRNPRILSSLPAPFLSLASFQLTGRGRGSNIWLSPAGCLQFSLLLRVDLASLPSNKLVFVQYLFALAIAEACRDPNVLGAKGEAVRIKWPNDIYVITKTGEKKKVGGILVNTSFSGKRCDIVIGSGTNILNPPPIFSLSQLQDVGDTPLNMETVTATILAKFESIWTKFTASGGRFEPFLDLYMRRWLHSDQLVTLTTTTPHQQVRIAGITTDFGLLRTVPERRGWSTGEEGFIDLQPDGNSFDLMEGMIKSKS
ncbi:class II aaRS and biotin synthetase [Cylindrobasidium torrendii FP15055 ss-10]|uniref:Class II aaRS and biotin synthetase n=1 Tax=Cylindrobasidium torrendii FP15055 ss-10 TaxID=1314674 RepID=A0A0D7BTT9_9AGAR|nr:class II aaRS and biotin synthetase [Cylindrobasidium torrendii FP15055 ss-10]